MSVIADSRAFLAGSTFFITFAYHLRRGGGQKLPPLYLKIAPTDMIDKELLIKTVEEALEGTDMYIVDVTVSPTDVINVEIDSDSNVDIDTCARITRLVESVFDRDIEDYELEVGSAGLTAPLKVLRQYTKNLGNDMEVLTRDGRKLRGILAEATEDGADIAFGLDVQSKEKEPGAKRPVLVTRRISLKASECKYVRYDLKF